jgi:tetratricopeptide (TPR) repeat protein
MNIRLFLAIIASLLVLLFWYYYSTAYRGAVDFENLGADVAYVGNKECAYCHREISQSFLRTGMGRSFYRPGAQPDIEDYTDNNHVYDRQNNLHYEMIAAADGYYQVEYRENDQAVRTHELRRKVDYVVGSGNNNRTYLASENGYINEMPVTWYSEKEIWDLSPGYNRSNMRFNRPVVAECMHCHNSYNAFEEFSVNRYTGTITEGISCERCHGPGQLHVDKHMASADELNRTDVDRTIVNPAHLSAELQMDVCLQCHLQGEISVFKTGKSSSDFRPGMHLKDIKTVFIEDGLPKGDFRIASHGGRISLSTCFTASNGSMTCITCHNPHEPVQERSRTYFNDRCMDCHATESLTVLQKVTDHSNKGDCVHCHMKQGATSDILHVNFTDHWIRKKIDKLSEKESDALFSRETVLKLRDFFEEGEPGDPAAIIRKGIAYTNYYETRHSEPSYLVRAIILLEQGLRDAPEHLDGYYALARAFQLQGKDQQAVAAYQRVLSLDPTHMWTCYQLGRLYLDEAPERSAAYLARAIQLNPDNPKVWKEYGDALLFTEDVAGAKTAYERALALDSFFASAYNRLGELEFYQHNDLQAAATNFTKAIQQNPDHTLALHNLANIAVFNKDLDQAENYSRRVIAVDPKFSASYGTLASISRERGQFAQAEIYLRKLIALEPNNQQALSMLRELNHE